MSSGSCMSIDPLDLGIIEVMYLSSNRIEFRLYNYIF